MANVLGTEYTVIATNNFEEYPYLKEMAGYTDYTTKTIVVRNYNLEECQVGDCKNQMEIMKRVIRHELTHAFMYESGLWCNSEFGDNEELTDWIAIQFPKMLETFNELEVI